MMTPRVQQGTVVLVDDSETDLLVATKCYEKSGLPNDLRTLMSGAEFLAYLDAVEAGEEPFPGLVLLDINMPGLDGFEVLRRTRARPAFADLPIFVMLTNSDDPNDIEEAFACGANGFQVKPTRIRDYVAFFESLAAS